MPQKVTQEKTNQIIDLLNSNHTYDDICKITKSSKRTVVKIFTKNLHQEYPTITIPEDVRETQYPGYYVTEDGRVYRRPGKYDRNGKYGEINEYGLIQINYSFRGNSKYQDLRYKCVNISTYDENGNYKQIKRYIHQLVAETFVENPNEYNEIDHIDRNKLNNHYTNLRWISRFENASTPNHKSYTITDTITNEIWVGNNLREWVKGNYELINSRTKKKNQTVNNISKHLTSARNKSSKIWGFKIEY